MLQYWKLIDVSDILTFIYRLRPFTDVVVQVPVIGEEIGVGKSSILSSVAVKTPFLLYSFN